MAKGMKRFAPTPYLQNLVQRLGGRWYGDYAMCRCPAHDDRIPSLSLRQGQHAILVTCHAGCTRETVVRLLGLDRAPGSSVLATPLPNVCHTTSRAALALWSRAGTVEDTLAVRYLCEVRGFARTSVRALHDIRYLERCPLGSGKSASYRPALLVAMRKADRVCAVQRIFLDPQTAACTGKFVLGRAVGAAWSNGRPAPVMGICEGFESAAAFTCLTGIQAFATMGAARFHQIELPQGLERLILLADNDREGRRAQIRASRTLVRPGLAIETRWPPRGLNDWADALKQ